MLSLSQMFAVAIGAFYVFAGFFVVRHAAIEAVMDRVLAALSDESAGRERLRTQVLTVGAYLTLASGVALMVLSGLAVVVFAANAVWQGGYLV